MDGVPVKILLDTGSTRTFVRCNLVPKNKIVVGKTVSVSCIHGESTRYPLADLDVTIGGNQFRVRAGVSDKLPVPLLLGRDVPELSRLLGTSVGNTSSECSVGSISSQSSVGSRSTSSESSVGNASSESSVGSISSQSSVGSSSTSSESNIGSTSSESSVDSSSPVTSGSLDAVEVVAVTTQAQSRRQGEGVGQAVVTAEPESEEIWEWILMMNYLGTVVNALV